MNAPTPLARRQFLQKSSAATAAIVAAPWLARSATGANERIRIGMIGTGDRASQLMKEILAAREKCNVDIVAVCDVWKVNREAAAGRVKQASGTEPQQFTRYAELLALKDVDAVVIATPDFSHGQILVASLEAGKDVYIEKPMTIDIASANRALDLARAKMRMVQAGTQRRSDGRFLAASKLVASGVLGKINRISGAMFVNAPRWMRPFDNCREADVDWEAFCLGGRIKRTFDPRLLRCWQLFRDTTNGIPGLWMTHYADAVSFVTGVTYPTSAVALGGTFVWQDGREHADTFHTLVAYPEGFLFDWGMGLGNSAGVHFNVHGTKGTLDLEKWTCSTEGAAGVKAAEAAITKVTAEPAIGHMENWLQCLRSRERPVADIQFGHQHAVTTIMVATAAETGLRQTWDAKKRELIAS